MGSDAWRACYAVWGQAYDSPDRVARAVVREMITRAVEAKKTQDIGYDSREVPPNPR